MRLSIGKIGKAGPGALRRGVSALAAALALAASMLLPAAGTAQELVGSSFKVDRYIINNGGSPVDADGYTRRGAQFASFDSLGQPAIDVTNGTLFRVRQGYLYEFFNPPLEPTALFANTAAAGAQTGAATPVANLTTLTPVFSALFNDPDLDRAVKYRIQVSTDSTFVNITHWDSGAAGTGLPTVASGARCSDIAYGGSPLSYGGVTYFWRIKFFDDTAEEGSFSQAAQFTTSSTLFPVLATPNGVAGTGYAQTPSLSGGNGPYAWTVIAGALPAGLGLDPSTGAISGTPAGAETASFTLQVADSSVSPQQVATASGSITIAPDLAILTAALPNGIVGSGYSQALSAAGGNAPLTFAVVAGALPPGLGLDPASGVISGVPNASVAASFTVRATDATVPPGPDTFEQALSITVADDLVILTAGLPAATQDASYLAGLTRSGGNGTVTWSLSAGALPTGLALDPATGIISGVPTLPGGVVSQTSNFTVTLMDSTTPSPDVASQPLSIVVNVAPLVLTSASVPNGTVGAAYSATLSSTGGLAPLTWTVASGALPPGLTLDASSATIAGAPTSAGPFTFTAQVADAQTPTPFSDSRSLTLTVNAALTITTGSLADGYRGESYSGSIAVTGGEAPYTFTVVSGALPAGLLLDSATGALSGTTTTVEVAAFTVQVVDSTPGGAATTSRAFTLTVHPLRPPLNLSAIASNGQVDLSWDPVSGAAFYKVYYGSDQSGVHDGTDAIQGASPIGNVTLNSVTLTGLSNTLTYYIAITALTAQSEEGPKSSEIEAKPLPRGQKTHTRVLAAGTEGADYRMIGWPVAPSNQDPIANISDDLGPYNDTQWRLIRWNAADQVYEETATTGDGSHKVEPGAGYWIIVREGGTIDITGDVADASTEYVITLHPGWNMVGHPWDFPVLISDFTANGVPFLDAANTLTRQDVWDFNGNYLSVSETVSGRAYWIKNLTQSTVALGIPPIPSPSANQIVEEIVPTPQANPSTGTVAKTAPAGSFRYAGPADELPPPPPGSGLGGGAGIATIAGLKHGGGGGGGGCFALSDYTFGTENGAAPALALGFLALAALRRRRLAPVVLRRRPRTP